MASPSAFAGAALLVLLVLQAPLQSSALSAGELFRVCRRSDPQLGDCIKQSVQELLPKLVKGIPELKIASHDPVLLTEVSIRQGQGPVSIASTFTNTTLQGISNLEFISAKADMEKNEMTFQLKMPYLYTEGDYKLDGRILLVPIKGQGYGRTNYTGLTGTAVLRGHREKRGGKEFLEPDALVVDIHIEKATMLLDNLFGGDKLLGETVNRLMNENWQLLFNEMKPGVDEAVGLLLKNSAQRVFRRFTLDELLPQ